MRIAFVSAIATCIVVLTVLAIILSRIPTKDYSLTVDALKDEQSLFTNARVVLSNTGRFELTNVKVSYDGNATEFVGNMDPGHKTTVSPPGGTELKYVIVTADHGIQVVQQYRSPIKLPGMIGS